MFEFTVPAKRLASVEGWLEHFKRVGRSAGIVAHYGRVSVWRTGAMIIGAPKDATYREHTDLPRGKLIKAVNGFEHEWPGGVDHALALRSLTGVLE